MKMDKKELLDAKIPANAVKSREQAGRQLQYLSGAYIINRLNEVLGHGQWSCQIKEMKLAFEGKVPQRNGEAYGTSYFAIICLTTNISGVNCYYEDVGYGDGTDRTNPGKAHELAVKEAVTDGIKRCAKNLGRSMGLGLYFDSEDHIESEKPMAAPPKDVDEDFPAFDELPETKEPPKTNTEGQGVPFSTAIEQYGETGCLDLLLKQPADEGTINFWHSLLAGAKKYGRLTPPQKNRLAENWFKHMVRPYENR
jgi:recombination DNA repair RAD52 pathway protein